MKHILITLPILFLAGWLMAQSPLGHTTITFNDPSRTGGFGSGGGAGRQIQSEIYYPATTAGEDVPVASGTYPVVVFGHGFVMSWDAYENIWEEIAPQGFIMVFPRTEGGFTPDHNEFGLDLALCVNAVQNLHSDAGSLFYNHIMPESAIMGHSMGGGATFLAAANNTTIETVIGLAPAETTPSAIAAASSVSVPALILSGSADGVTPPADHHLPIYSTLNVPCKHFVSITGGAHCYFANANFNCDFGEGTSSTGISISRTDQHQVMFDYVSDWLAYKLKDDCAAWANFTSNLPIDGRVTYQDSCTMAAPTITSSGGTTFCEGESVDLVAPQSLDWSNGAMGISITVDSSGSYYAYNSSTCEVSNTINITVNPNPITSVSQSGASLSADQSNGIYQWVDCNASFQTISGANNQNYSASSNGDYAVVIDLNGCVDTSACANVTGLSLWTNQQDGFKLYPSPTQGSLTIQSNASGRITFYGIEGDLVRTIQLNEGINHIDLNVANGVYLWQTIHDEGQVRSGKLVVE